MSSKLPASLQASEEDIQMMLAAQVHLGTKNCDKTMEPYVYKRRADGECFWEWMLLLLAEGQVYGTVFRTTGKTLDVSKKTDIKEEGREDTIRKQEKPAAATCYKSFPD